MFTNKFTICKIKRNLRQGIAGIDFEEIKNFDKQILATSALTTTLNSFDAIDNRLLSAQNTYNLRRDEPALSFSSVIKELEDAENAKEKFFKDFGFIPEAGDEYCITHSYVFQRDYSK